MLKRRRLISVLVALSAGIAAHAAWAAPQRVTACTTITSPGSYRLSQDVDGTAVAGDCIIIGSSNVTLDLNGFTITGPGSVGGVPTGSGIFASSGFKNVAVRNGTVTGFVDGVTLCPGSIVAAVRAVDNSGWGINVNFDSLVRGNIARGNGAQGLIFAEGATVINNVAAGNGGDGFYGICPATVIGNTSTGNTGVNLNLTNSVDCTQADNTAP